MKKINKIYNEDCLEGIKKIDDASIDVILTDPPYLYLKNQKLDIPFDEDALFKEFKRVLKKDGFVVLFGRGTSFYRWNTKLSEIGFKFKEEIIWNKRRSTAPTLPISRIHETISIFTKCNGIIKKCKINYIEMKKYDIKSIVDDMKRLSSELKKPNFIEQIIDFINKNSFNENTSFQKSKRGDYGYNEHKVEFAVTIGGEIKDGNRAMNTVQSMQCGLNEKSIIEIGREHYATIHPTQKPVRLLERLLNLVCEDGSVVLDPFSGSGSTACACINTNRNFIGFEIDKEYFDKSIERINTAQKQLKLF